MSQWEMWDSRENTSDVHSKYKVAKHVTVYVGLVYGCSCLQVTQ